MASAALRTQAVVFLLAFAVANLGELVHEATVLHQRCLEHGELIHGVIDPGAIAAPSPERDLRRTGRSPADDDHDHCYVSVAPHQRAAVDSGVIRADVAAPTFPAPLAPATASVAATVALFRTAPKTSPPA